MRAFSDSIPAIERERQRRLGRLHLPAIDEAHPPSQLRADVVRAARPAAAAVRPGPDNWQVIDGQLAPVLASVAAQLRGRTKIR